IPEIHQELQKQILSHSLGSLVERLGGYVEPAQSPQRKPPISQIFAANKNKRRKNHHNSQRRQRTQKWSKQSACGCDGAILLDDLHRHRVGDTPSWEKWMFAALILRSFVVR